MADQLIDSKVLSGTRRGSGFFGLVVVLIAWGAILFSFRTQVRMVLDAWDTLPSHEHGYVVLVVVAYLLWSKLPVLRGEYCRPSWKGFAALVLTGFLAMLGELVSVAAVVQFAIVLMMISAVWAVTGDEIFRRVLGPLFFLLFAVPFGQEILPVLMNWTADATVVALRHSGVPVYQEGRNFVIPSGQWSVVEACGGIRYLLTSVFIGAVFAYLTYTQWRKRILFMLWAIVMPLIANWIRAYVIVMVAHKTANEWGLGLSHIALGWVIFGVSIFASFAIGARWRDPVPEHVPSSHGIQAPMPVLMGATLLAAAIPFGWHMVVQVLQAPDSSDTPSLRLESLATLPQGESADDAIRPHFPGARVVHQATYTYQGQPVDVFVAYYRNQTQGTELINIQNQLEPTKKWGWSISTQPPNDSPNVPDVRLEGFVKKGVHAAVYHFYWVNGMTTTSDFTSKILEALSRLRGRGDDAAAVAITAYSPDSVEAARVRTAAFANEHIAGILADLERTATADRK